MKSLLKKEIRELAVWTAIGTPTAILITAFLTMTGYDFALHSWRTTADSLYSAYVGWMVCVSALAGLTIGIAQIGPEIKRDHWAFLIHRPLTPSRIWTAKVIAGIGAYLTITFLPLLIVTGWFCLGNSFPGPFEFRMILPGFSSVLAGLSFYFAGQLIMLRRARWYGSRFLPGVVAFFGLPAAAAVGASDLSPILAIIFVIFLGIAAHGSFKSGGEWAGQNRLERTALGAVMAAGIVVVSIIAFALSASIWLMTTRSDMGDYISEELALSKTGHVVILDQLVAHNTELQTLQDVKDLQGNLIPGADPDVNSYQRAQTATMRLSVSSFASYSHYFIPLQIQAGNELLFFDTDRCIYDVYTAGSCRFVGYMGSDSALNQNPASCPPFVGTPSNPTWEYLQFSDGVYHFEWPYPGQYDPKFTKVLTAPEGDPFTTELCLTGPPNTVTAGYEHAPSAHFRPVMVRGTTPILIAISRESVSTYNEATGAVSTVALPRLFSTANPVLISGLSSDDGKQIYILYNGEYVPIRTGAPRTPLAGTIVERSGGLNFMLTPHEGEQTVDYSPLQASWAALLPTGLFAAVYPVNTLEAHANPNVDVVNQSYSGSARDMYVTTNTQQLSKRSSTYVFVWMVVGALLACVPMVFVARRYGASGAGLIPWMACALLLNWLGIVTILAMRPFPAMIDCPKCGHKRPIDADLCPNCGAEMTGRGRDGREIFDEADLSLRNLAVTGS